MKFRITMKDPDGPADGAQREFDTEAGTCTVVKP